MRVWYKTSKVGSVNDSHLPHHKGSPWGTLLHPNKATLTGLSLWQFPPFIQTSICSGYVQSIDYHIIQRYFSGKALVLVFVWMVFLILQAKMFVLIKFQDLPRQCVLPPVPIPTQTITLYQFFFIYKNNTIRIHWFTFSIKIIFKHELQKPVLRNLEWNYWHIKIN